MPKLYLLDGMALAYRAHFAFVARPIVNSKGMNTSALFGFTGTLLDLIEKQQPTHMAVVLDTDAPTERHKEFAGYKATRQEMPEDLALALGRLPELIEAFRIPLITKDGYEADDIIGTLARRAAHEGWEVYMVTPDKDFGQLVDERVFIFRPSYKGDTPEILGVPEVLARWGIKRPGQVIDILALMGDASDNIPGIKGIGEKTAQKLIEQFESVEELLAQTDKLKGKQRETVEAGAEAARLSKRLATIDVNVPLDVDLNSLELREPDRQRLRAIFEELEFRRHAQRVLGSAPAVPAAEQVQEGAVGGEDAEPDPADLAATAIDVSKLKKLADVPHEYLHITDAAGRGKLIATLRSAEVFAFDLETDDLDALCARPLGIAFAWQKGHAAFVRLGGEIEEARAILTEFREVFENPGIRKVGHNLKFDLAVLAGAGISVSGELFDTMLAHALIDPETRHGMDHLAQVYLGYAPVPISALIGEKGDASLLEMTDPAALAAYAAEDADVALQLAEKFEPLLRERGQERVFFEIEMPLLPVLVSMEIEGVKIEPAVLAEFGKELEKVIAKAQEDIWRLAGREFQVNSPKQLGQVLFEELKLVEKPKKTATGQYATSEQVLQALAPRHMIVRRLLDFREAIKLKNTYVDKLPEAISKKTGRVHTSYGQLQTVTGRLQSDRPNLQNIPIRTELGREIRKAFVARDARHVLLSADYSQIELRIIASMSGDEGLKTAFESGQDIHAATAAKIYDVRLENVTREMRSKAKMVNFGIPYGITPFGLAQRLGASRGEAAELINQYFSRFPRVREFIEETLAFARRNGYVETLSGRRRYLRDINSRNMTTRMAAERNAINMPVQGTAADMIKLAMSRIATALRREEFKTKLLLQVHDELVFEVPKTELEAVKPLIHDAMAHALPMDVPIEVEMGHGQNWLEAH